MTNAELAGKLGVSKTTVSRWLNGTQGMWVVDAENLATALRLKLAALAPGDAEEQRAWREVNLAMGRLNSDQVQRWKAVEADRGQ